MLSLLNILICTTTNGNKIKRRIIEHCKAVQYIYFVQTYYEMWSKNKGDFFENFRLTLRNVLDAWLKLPITIEEYYNSSERIISFRLIRLDRIYYKLVSVSGYFYKYKANKDLNRLIYFNRNQTEASWANDKDTRKSGFLFSTCK